MIYMGTRTAITTKPAVGMPDFLLNALIVGTIIALMAGPLGCFVVWRRMAYFGAAIAHSALLGIALSLFLGSVLLSVAVSIDDPGYRLGQFLIDDPGPLVLLVSLLLAYALLLLQRRHLLSSDTLLGIVAHGSLAMGLIIVATMDSLRIDLMSYLFGDILSISRQDIIVVTGLGLVVMVLLKRYWQALLSSTVNAELARVEGINTYRVELLFVLLLACVIALGMRIVGILLIISMLIIPPATARSLSSTPRQMALIASLIGVLDVWLGIAVAWHYDLPAGPAIVVVSTLLFMLVFLLPNRQNS